MSAPEGSPRERRKVAQRGQIMAAALQIANEEGWLAVTTRRVAQAIDYSQPVIYQHFTGRQDLIDAVARNGFESLRALTDEFANVAHERVLQDLCRAYLAFAAKNQRLYEAMFTRPTVLAFASADTPAELRESFLSLRRAMAGHVRDADPDEAAELLWATCHGLVSLRAAGRIPQERIEAHIARVTRMWD